MGSFGSLGVVHVPVEKVEVEPDTFDYFGFTIRVADEVSDVELIDVMASVRRINGSNLSTLGVIKDCLELVILEDDFDLFWKAAGDNNQTTTDLIQVFMTLIEGETDRPTLQQSDSSPGLLSTDENSPGTSLSVASAGRPDLQLIYDDSRASKEQAARDARRMTG